MRFAIEPSDTIFEKQRQTSGFARRDMVKGPFSAAGNCGYRFLAGIFEMGSRP
jgi:hypothetical protein